ncbi:MAG: hypothetical protein ACP5R0_05065 [Thermoplasmata archaeon]
MEMGISLFRHGVLNLMRYEEGFPWERIIIDAMKYGMSTYIILGNYLNINFRLLHTALKRLKFEEKILIRRGFTYYQILQIVLELSSYHDLILFFHDPISFQDLSTEEKFALSQAVMLNLLKYAETFDTISVFAHTDNFNFQYNVKRINAKPIKNGWKIISEGEEKFIYSDPAQVSLDYYLEV